MRYCHLCGFVVVCQLVHSQSAQAQNEPLPDGTRLTFRAPTTTEERQFAFAQLRRMSKMRNLRYGVRRLAMAGSSLLKPI